MAAGRPACCTPRATTANERGERGAGTFSRLPALRSRPRRPSGARLRRRGRGPEGGRRRCGQSRDNRERWRSRRPEPSSRPEGSRPSSATRTRARSTRFGALPIPTDTQRRRCHIAPSPVRTQRRTRVPRRARPSFATHACPRRPSRSRPGLTAGPHPEARERWSLRDVRGVTQTVEEEGGGLHLDARAIRREGARP